MNEPIALTPSDAAPDASSPSPTATPAPKLSALSVEERTAWRKTGDLPAATTAASPAAPAGDDPPAATAATSEPASEPDPVKAKTKKDMDRLLADRHRERERADRLERELAALKTPKADAPVASSPATAQDPEPDPATYTDLTKFFKDQSAWAVRQALREKDATDQAVRARESEQATVRQLEETWQARVTEAQRKHADFDVNAIAARIPARSLIDHWVLESPEVGGELLYAFQTQPAELDRILALPMLAQVRELVKWEMKIATPAIQTKTTAPDPAPTLGTRATGADPVTSAIKGKNTGAYIREANRREMAARKGH